MARRGHHCSMPSRRPAHCRRPCMACMMAVVHAGCQDSHPNGVLRTSFAMASASTSAAVTVSSSGRSAVTASARRGACGCASSLQHRCCARSSTLYSGCVSHGIIFSLARSALSLQ